MTNQVFVNLPVQDLGRTRTFFANVGFTFDAQFSDENALCIRLTENTFVLFLVEDFFQRFTTRGVSDTTRGSEMLLAVSVESRAEVDETVEAALRSGATEARQPQDYESMYGRSFEDLDGHIWEVIWMEGQETA